MPIPWEISAALAATALSVLGVVAGLTGIAARRTLRNAAVLSSAAERHLPAIRQNIDEIQHNASALATSLQALSEKASATAEGFEGVNESLRRTVQTLETGVIEPGQKILKVVSIRLAFNTVIRRLRRPLGPFRVR